MEAAFGEILVLPFYGQGHLNPCMELCKRIVSHNFKATFIIPFNLSSSVPASFHRHPLIEVVEIPNSSPPPEMVDADNSTESEPYPSSWDQTKPEIESGACPPWRQQMAQGLESFLSERYANSGRARPVSAVIDVMMNGSKKGFMKLNIPVVSFFTSGACFSAMEYAMWKENANNLKPGESRIFPGLPEAMALTYADIKRSNKRRDGMKNHGGKGVPYEPGSAPEPVKIAPWWEQAADSLALLFNTCDDLDDPFIKYIVNQIRKPVWGVGPMLPEKYWKSTGSIVHDHEVRSNKEANVTEEEVLQWLNSKPINSVVYVSFGSEVGPTMEECGELASALGESNRPFIWVIQPGSGVPGPPRSFRGGMLELPPRIKATEEGYYPHGLDEKVGERGIIIKGWAPQLLILSHPSVGGFLSHCGWNSTGEAIGRGVPILAWPIGGDQFYNAKLVVNILKIGHTLLTSDDPFATMKKDEIMRGIDILLDDEEVHKQAMAIGYKFQQGFPASSEASLKAFFQLVTNFEKKLGG